MNLDPRLQEAEIKLAFLEKELADYREAVDGLHAELSRLTKRVRALEAREGAQAPGFGAESPGEDPGAIFGDPASSSAS